MFSRKPLFGYRAFVFATLSIGALSFAVWAHHMFATGAVLLPFFSIMTFLISVPTGVKMFNWIATMWGGKIKLDTPMLFADRVPAGVPDRRHQRRVRRGRAVRLRHPRTPTSWWRTCTTCWSAARCSRSSPAFYFWMPKMTGRSLSEPLGKVQFWLLFIGVNLTFFPMHILGLNGMQRRIADYPANAGLTGLNQMATARRGASSRCRS